MKTIVYYKVSFDKKNLLSSMMVEKSFENWDDACKYMNAVIDNAKKHLREKFNHEDVIADNDWENPFEKKLALFRQIVCQDTRYVCRIYTGYVDRKILHLY